LMIYQVGLQLISPIFDIIFGPKYFISSLFWSFYKEIL
jgi:hypothetical protein